MDEQTFWERLKEHFTNKFILENILKQLILWLLVLFFSLLLWEAIKGELEGSKMRKAALETADGKEQEMRVQIAEQEDKQLALLQEYVQTVSAKSCVILCFDDFGKTPYQEIIQTMDRYGYTGVIVFRDGKIPGTKGSISVELYKELLAKGWEGAIGNKKDIRVYHNTPDEVKRLWRQYMQVMLDGFKNAGLEPPSVYIPHKNETVSEVTADLIEMGMHAYTTREIFHEDVETPMNTDSMLEMDLFRAGYYYDALGTDLARIIPTASSMALWFEKVENGKPNNSHYTSIYMVKKHLERLYMYSDFVKVTTFSGYQDYQKELLEKNQTLWQNYQAERLVIQERMESLEEQIWEMYQQIFSIQ